jgi:aminopeptidase N
MLLTSAAAARPRAPAPPAGDFAVFHYDLELDLDRARKRVRGRERLWVRSEADGLAAVAFPCHGIRVRSVTGPGGAALAHVDTSDQLEIRLPAPLARGRVLPIVVQYEAVDPAGIYFSDAEVHTGFDTCHWMLCRDRPDDKATLRLSLPVPDGELAVASGEPAANPEREPGGVRQVWNEPVRMSPYLFGFAIGRFTRTQRAHKGVLLEYDAVGVDQARLERMFADDDRMLDFFVGKAGRSLAHSFYRQVVVDGGIAQEMTSFSVIGRDNLEPRLAKPEEDWAVAHEMAHQLWGNVVTCADWSHFWLNEGLTVFMVAAYKEERWGRAAYERELALARERYRGAVEASFDVPLAFAGAYPSLRIKRAITYSKALLFLDRLRAAMGERAFWGALKSYTRRFAGGLVRSQDFQREFAAATKVDLTPLFNEWVYAR